MSCALQALAPASLLTNDISCWSAILKPDDHGGFEMGTWTFGGILDSLELALPESLSTKANPQRARHVQLDPKVDHHGYGIEYTYSTAQCEAIVKWLKGRPLYTGKGSSLEKPGYLYHESLGGLAGLENPVLVILEKWHQRLIELFGTGSVVHYCA